MSSIFKTLSVNVDNRGKRVVDTNELIELKIAKLREEEERKKQAGFVPGIIADDANGEEFIGEGAEDGLDGILSDNDSEGSFTPGLHATPVQSVDTEAMLAEAGKEAQEIIDNANAQAEEIINDAIAQAQDEIQAAKEEARALGYQDGVASAQAELDKIALEFQEKENALMAEYENAFDNMEAQLVDTITDVYEHIFGVDLSGNKQILTHLVANTIRRIDGPKSFLVHVSSADKAAVSENKSQLMDACAAPGSQVEIIEDMSLAQNQCFIETDGGIFDCGLDTQLSELTQKIRLLSYEKR